MTGDPVITAEEIRRTCTTIKPYVRRTPVIEIDLAALTGSTPPGPALVLKLEQLQCGGSFKARGAFANLLLREVPAPGVAAASGGNHGVAVAYAAHRLGVPAKIFVPGNAASVKIETSRSLGADVVVGGDHYTDALAASERWVATCGAMSVHAFDQTETLLGQATLGLELAEQVPDLDTVLVPVGGGGLIAGIAAHFAGAVRVVGVEPVGAPTLTFARANGGPTDAPTDTIAAGALAAARIGKLVFPITEAYVSDVVLVDDEDIRTTQRTLWRALRVAAEPAAATALAALVAGAYRPEPGERVAVVITGANTALAALDAPPQADTI